MEGPGGGGGGGGGVVLAVALQVRTGEIGPQKQVLHFCAAVANFLTVLLYTLTQPL